VDDEESTTLPYKRQPVWTSRHKLKAHDGLCRENINQ